MSLAETCLELVATPSETGQEAAIADLVAARCTALGATFERVGHNVVAATGADGPPIVLAGHVDTVPNWPGGTAQLVDGRVVGRGASDMKAGVAVMLHLLERLRELPRKLVYLFYDAEEGPYDDSGIHRALPVALRHGTPEMGILLEPTNNRVRAGSVGSVTAEVAFAGRQAHAARAWEGENAIAAGAGAIERLLARAPRPVEVDGLTYYDTVTLTRVRAGIASNVVPDRLELTVDARLAPGRAPEAARAEVERLAGGGAQLAWVDHFPSAPPSLTLPPVARFLASTGAAVDAGQGCTDVASLYAAGIPAFNFGPGDPGQAHQTGEYAEVAALEACAAQLERYLTDG